MNEPSVFDTAFFNETHGRYIGNVTLNCPIAGPDSGLDMPPYPTINAFQNGPFVSRERPRRDAKKLQNFKFQNFNFLKVQKIKMFNFLKFIFLIFVKFLARLKNHLPMWSEWARGVHRF